MKNPLLKEIIISTLFIIALVSLIMLLAIAALDLQISWTWKLLSILFIAMVSIGTSFKIYNS